jgi:hypothetical protein
MPFEYKVDTLTSEKDLESTINYWAEGGYEPHNIISILRKSSLSETPIPVLLLIIRKVIRRSRKDKK